MIVLIDADILVYQAGYAAEHAQVWDDGLLTVQADPIKGIEELDDAVRGIVHATEARKVVMALSCPTHENFRRDFYQPYKEPRTDPTKRSAKPILYSALRQHVRDTYPTREKPRMEADDVLGILHTMLLHRGRSVVASIDKDLLTVPGLHYNWRKKDDGIIEVTSAEAMRAFFTQVLTGDSTDNYPGCPGIGKVRAAKLLDGIEGARPL